MKAVINKLYLGVFVILMVSVNSCVEPDDLMTADAKTGGLVNPLTSNVPYKLGATPDFDVDLSVVQGPGIASVEVLKSFETVDGDLSNEVLLTTIDVGSQNSSKDVESSFTLTYTDLKKDITVGGSPLPDDELDLSIGDAWTLNYISVMEDGRKVVNNGKTVVAVANFFAGSYESKVWYEHPTAGWQTQGTPYNKNLLALSADRCKTTLAVWSDISMFITILGPSTVKVESDPDEWDELHGIDWGENSYDPATGYINIFYGYSRSNGTRKFEEQMRLK